MALDGVNASSVDAGLTSAAHGAGAGTGAEHEHAHMHAHAHAAERLVTDTHRAELLMSVLISTVVAIVNKILQTLLAHLVAKERPSQVRRWR